MSWDKFVIVADTHGDAIYRPAQKAFFEFCDDFKPVKRLHLGDWVDLRAWRRGASASDQADSMQKDYDAGLGFLKRYNADVVITGNHDYRLWLTAKEGRGPMQDYAKRIVEDFKGEMDAIGCQIMPYGIHKGFYELGKVRNGGYYTNHGYRAGIHAIVGEARHWNRSISGHIHAVGTYVDAAKEARSAHTVGTLARLDMDYGIGNEGTARHENAWGYGWENSKTGAVEYRHCRKIGREWMYSDEIKGVR